MSVIYQLAVSPGQADSYLEHGFDFVAGFAVDARDAAEVTDVGELIELLCCAMPGSPFSPDTPIDILHVPTGPFIQTREAVGPLHPHAFLGGIVEAQPFNGTGIARTGTVSTPLLWMEPTRLTDGSQLWRFYPGISEPELRGVYHGAAWGWETVKTGSFTACVPSQFIGPVTMRPWGLAPVDVELDDTGTAPAALTIVAPSEPPEEGFEELPTGLWAKRIEFHEGLDVFEYQAQGRLKSIPVRVLRHLSQQKADAQLTAHVCSMLLDAPVAAAAGFSRYSQAIHTAVVPFAEISDQIAREARPGSWDMSSRPALTMLPRRERDNTDPQALVTDILALVAAVAPTGWTQLRYLIQMIGSEVNFSAAATVPQEGEAAEHGEPRTVPLPLVPTATLHYARQIKIAIAKHRDTPGEGAAFSMLFTFESDGKAGLTFNLTDAPPWAKNPSRAAWDAELAEFPRDSEHIPEWLHEILDAPQDLPDSHARE